MHFSKSDSCLEETINDRNVATCFHNVREVVSSHVMCIGFVKVNNNLDHITLSYIIARLWLKKKKFRKFWNRIKFCAMGKGKATVISDIPMNDSFTLTADLLDHFFYNNNKFHCIYISVEG